MPGAEKYDLDKMTVTEKNAYKWRRAASVAQVVAISWQWSIVFVFWAFVAAIFLPEANWVWRFGLIGAHTFPFVQVMVEFYVCDSRLRFRDIWVAVVLAVTYVFINYYYTKHDPEPVYPFLLWDNFWKNVGACVLCALVGCAGVFLTGYIQEKVMGRPIKDSW